MKSPFAFCAALLSSFLLAGAAAADDVYRCVPVGSDKPVFVEPFRVFDHSSQGGVEVLRMCSGGASLDRDGKCPAIDVLKCAQFEKTDSDSFEYLAQDEHAPPMLRDAAQQFQTGLQKADEAKVKAQAAIDRLEDVEDDDNTGIRNADEGLSEIAGLSGYAAESGSEKRSKLLEDFRHGSDSVKIAALLLAKDGRSVREGVLPPLGEAEKALKEAKRLGQVGSTDLDAYQGDLKKKNVPGLSAEGREAMEKTFADEIASCSGMLKFASDETDYQQKQIYGTLLQSLTSLRESLDGPTGALASEPKPQDVEKAWMELKPKVEDARSALPHWEAMKDATGATTWVLRDGSGRIYKSQGMPPEGAEDTK